MRARVTQDNLTVQAVAGTYVVLLGLDLPKKLCKGLLGFGVHRTDHTENEANWMQGQKTFAETDPGRGAGAKFSTRQHPIQGFTWSDFSAKPGHDYTYRIVALKGTPAELTEFASASVRVQTESPAEDGQDVYFNRGAAASQEYARRFHNKPPDEVGQAAFTWLSRGLFEAMKGFIDRAKKGEALRVAAYEFHYKPVLQALKEAAERGVDVKVVYDRRKDVPGEGNDKAIDAVGIRDLCTPRTASPSAISHNKFIVHLRNKKPVAVLTGGTNFSEGGIFGHSNALHVVGEPKVAAAYLRYWELLHGDPESKTLRPTLSDEFPVPENEPPEGTITIFSPRTSLQALEWYTARAAEAKDGLFATFAFGMHPDFQEVYRTSKARLRYALMEKATRPMPAGPAHDAEVQKIKELRLMPENRFAIGAFLKMNEFDDWKWRVERLSGLNKNVQYVHTKYMLIDPLGANPVVVAGSANFSAASTTSNDENMLVIRGNTRVADIYLGEFMRLYNHYAFREWAASQKGAAMTATPSHLKTDDSWWRNYFGDTPQSHQRAYFVSGEVPPQAVGARRLTVKGGAETTPRRPARRRRDVVR
jgi:phosphatidylserine/phosphatidylglycerophosphate/cardiolipin synthase-like enzyme